MPDAHLARLQPTVFPDLDLRKLMLLASPLLSFEANQDIPRDDASSNMLLLVEGWAARCRYIDSNRRQLPALFIPGDICNLDTFFEDRFVSPVTTLTPCVVASMPIEKVRAEVEHNPTLTNILWRLRVFENSVLTEWIVSLGRRSTRERLAHLLCELQLRLYSAGMAGMSSYALPITQQDLSDALGVSLVHLNRNLQVLRKEGFVTFKGPRLVLLDIEALKEISAFSPEYLEPDRKRE